MNNQQAVVDQIVQNLAFEVEATPKNKTIEAPTESQMAPMNVKIRVRKKDDIVYTQQKAVQNIRLVSSDQTIMNFDVFMEAEFEKKPQRKPRKHIFDILKPGICLGPSDDDDQPYMPSSSYKAHITEPTVTTKSDGTLKRTFQLSKNVYQDYTASAQRPENKWFFGKCKPGGCLDPPFSEDKYTYKPSTEPEPKPCPAPVPIIPVKDSCSQIKVQSLRHGDIESDDSHSKKSIKVIDDDEDVNADGRRRSSMLDGSFFKKKRRSSDKSSSTKQPDRTDSKMYQPESPTNSLNTRSIPIITYPPKGSSDLKINDDGPRSRGPSEEKSRRSFNEHSEPFFIPPKGINRIKERDSLKSSDSPKRQSSNVTELDKKPKESFKMPVPIPIPIPLPIFSKKDEPKAVPVNKDIFKTQGDNANITDVASDDELEDKSKLKYIEPPLQRRHEESATGDTDVNPIPAQAKVEDLSPLDKTKDESLSKLKLQPPILQSDSNMTDTKEPKKSDTTKPTQKSMPIPVPIPLDLNKPAENKDLKTSEIKSIKSEQSLGMEATQLVSERPRENDPTADGKPSNLLSDDNNKESEFIPKEYLRTRSDSTDQNGDTEENKSFITEETASERDMKPKEQPKKQNDIKPKDDIISDEDKPEMVTDVKKDNDEDTNYDDKAISDNDDNIESLRSKGPERDIDKILSRNETEPTKPKPINTLSNDDDLNTLSKTPHDESKNFIAAPIIIDKTEPTQPFMPLKQVNSKTDFFRELEGISELEDDDNLSQRTTSHELIGTNSVIYDANYFFPQTPLKNPEITPSSEKHVILSTKTELLDDKKPSISSNIPRTLSGDLRNKLPDENDVKNTLSDNPSTNVLKSVLKKDIISVDLGFYSYLNDKNERILKTLDTENIPTRYPNDSVTVIKSQLRISSNEIRIPIDAEHDISIQIKKPNTNQRVSISESGFGNVINDAKLSKQRAALPTSDGEIQELEEDTGKYIGSDITDDGVIDLYEHELVPLQMIIKNLRDEIDVLAAQQLLLRDKIFCPNKPKLPKLSHTNKKCFGCLRR